ncbi:hypothetical protein AAVH_15784 [Aphelenchoides avenae]|nr:hypothetical protein AAVH_15784 [Aphelenchus avenae]
MRPLLTLVLTSLTTLHVSAETLLEHAHENYVIAQKPTFIEHLQPEPVATVGGDKIWPRAYHESRNIFFDENGAAFALRPDAPSLNELLTRGSYHSLHYSSGAHT